MKILYAIQGTGNGHISRALEIIPLLRKKCETDVLISGNQADLELPFRPGYTLRGLSFVHGKNGGIDYARTYKSSSIKRFMNDVKELPVEDYDFVLNDFEPVSAWACYRRKVPCIALSHQSSLLDKNVPKPTHKDTIGNFVLKNYAPALVHFGFHFSRYSKNIFTPVIRKAIRQAERSDNGKYVVYLPAYSDEHLTEILGPIKGTRWEIFSRSVNNIEQSDNIVIRPVNRDDFERSLVSCRGVLCGAGFETPAETLFLGKKLMVIPMRNQYEQHYNAAALKSLGVPSIKKINKKKTEKIIEWVNSDYKIEITYPDITDKILNRIFELFVENKLNRQKWEGKYHLMPDKDLI
jgi:uncharacterized protein (TIGR00661 family)